MRKKILCLSRAPLDFKGGIPEYCKYIYKNLDHNITVANYSLDKKTKINILNSYTNINEITFPSEFVFGTFALSIKYFLYLCINFKKFEIVHLQHPDPFSSLIVIFLKLLNWKVKLLITWHAEIYKTYFLFSPALILIDFFTFSISNNLIFFTPSHVKDSFLAKIIFFRKKIKQIPFIIEHKDKKLQPKSYDVENKNDFIILSVGRLVKYKGYEYALDAVRKSNKKVKYYIIGDGPLKTKLDLLIKNYNLMDRVFLLGKVSDKTKEDYFKKSDIFLFPSISKSEAFGIVQLEAMSHGLPIINTKLNNGVNYLVPEDIGITASIKNAENLKNAINNLKSNNKLFCQKSINSINRFQQFLSEAEKKSFSNLINSL
tara:strand:+ start:3366 stop:4484 length:1119 start_codon:yes stop_codon:yes gene_type:complete